MLPPEKVVVRRPADERGTWRALLFDNQFDQIKCRVEQEHAQAVSNKDSERAALLIAARQLAASCEEMQNEASFHQQAFRRSEMRRNKLAAELNKLLEIAQLAPATAVPHPNSTIWQRMRRLWRREEEPDLLPGAQLETAVAPSIQPQAKAPELPFSPSKANCPQLTIYCLGSFRAYEDEHPIDEWPSRKGKAIFKYLLLHRQQRITKDVLMAQFWPESAADAARNNLNVAIYGLRQALRNGYPDFSHVLFQDDCYFLNPEMAVWVDVEQFTAVYRQANQLLPRGDTAVALQQFHAAEALYQGELLAEDPYEEWPAARRQQLQRQYMQVLTHLSEHYFAVEQYATCITYASKLLLVEPCHEATHCLLMRAYARQRQGYLALRQYHTCIELLAEELAAPPNPATTHLYEAIRQHQPV
ncbi:MAG: winged helix-turn-helix domain-containing protein [Ardenticatenaceae bacterium]|nr:winged helix-turn-helix domain-containing protein [Ardenticatenaceae bacterium]